MAANYAVTTAFNGVDNLSKTFSGMSKASDAFTNRTKSNFSSISNSATNLKTIIAGVFGGNILTMGLQAAKRATVDTVKELINMGDEVRATAVMLGISGEALQEYRFAAEQENIESESLTTGFKMLNRSMGELTTNQGTLFSTLKKTNPALLGQLKNVKSNEEAFNLVVGAIEKAPNQFKKAQLAQAAFGRGGQVMLKFAAVGVEGLKALRLEAQKNGIMSDEFTKNADAFNDSLARMKGSFGALLANAIAPLIPDIMKLLDAFKNFMMANRDMINTGVKAFFDGLVISVKTLYGVFKVFSGILKATYPLILSLVGAWILYKTVTTGMSIAQRAMEFMQLVRTIGLGNAALKQLTIAQNIYNLVMTANPIGLVITAFGILIGLTLVVIKNWDAIVAALKSAYEWFIKIAGIVGGKLGSALQGFKNLFTGDDKKEISMKKEIEVQKREAPNSAEVSARQQTSQFKGRLEVAGAPEGSKLSVQRGAKGFDVALLGAN